MINKALDLPFDEPTETYSTSEHLFHDQGIPPGTKGRIVDPAPVERKPREDRAAVGRPRTARPRDRNRNRSRSRTRNGAPVEGGTAAAARRRRPPRPRTSPPARAATATAGVVPARAARPTPRRPPPPSDPHLIHTHEDPAPMAPGLLRVLLLCRAEGVSSWRGPTPWRSAPGGR